MSIYKNKSVISSIDCFFKKKIIKNYFFVKSLFEHRETSESNENFRLKKKN